MAVLAIACLMLGVACVNYLIISLGLSDAEMWAVTGACIGYSLFAFFGSLSAGREERRKERDRERDRGEPPKPSRQPGPDIGDSR